MFVARDGVFLERECISQKPSGRNNSLEEAQDDQPQITLLVGEIVSPIGAHILVPVVPTRLVDVPFCRTSK